MKVRYIGEVGRGTGYGVAATQLCAALIRAGVKLEIRSLAPIEMIKNANLPLPVASAIYTDRELDPNPDAIIVHTLPGDCGRVLDLMGYGSGRPAKHPLLVAYTTWETLQAPAALTDGLGWFDQIWVPSQANEDAFTTPETMNRLRVVPHTFDEETYGVRRADAHVTRTVLGGVRPFQFYYVGAWTQRKNPAGVIRAFCHAFTRADPVQLLLQCSGARLESIAAAAGGTGMGSNETPSIRPSVAPLTDDGILDLHRTADCFVTASRGEAWNLPAFDAMLAGRHVIAPRGLGSDDFLGDTSAALYGSTHGIAQLDVRVTSQEGGKFDLEAIGAQGLTAKSIWLEPDLLHLAHYMQIAARDGIHRLHAPDPRQRFGYAAVAKLAMSYLTENAP